MMSLSFRAFITVPAVMLAVTAQGREGEASPWLRIQAALDAGAIHLADSLFTLAAKTTGARDIPDRHRHEILAARLAASRGDWRTTESRLREWKGNDSRLEGSGEIFFWLGWAALHQGKLAEADSLLVLATSYATDPRSQEALEYRFAALLDNSSSLQDYLRGLPESPLSGNLRSASLEKITPASRLYPHARWHLAIFQLTGGDTLKARETLFHLSQSSPSLPALRAAALWASLTERTHPDSALAAYEALLMRNQQGVIPEFARKMTKMLREGGFQDKE